MSWLSKTAKKVGHVLSKGTKAVVHVPETVLHGMRDAWQDYTGVTAANLQNEGNMRMWQLQNEYNTPANQMARFLEAGLNPNLMYSQGNAGNASSAPDFVAHQGKFGKMLDLVGSFLDMKGKSDSMNLQKVKTYADIQHSQEALELQRRQALIDNAFRTTELGLRRDDYNLRRDEYNWRKNHIDTWGTSPGSSIDFLNRFIGYTLGKPTTDVGTDANHLLNTAFKQIFYPVTITNDVGRWISRQAQKYIAFSNKAESYYKSKYGTRR